MSEISKAKEEEIVEHATKLLKTVVRLADGRYGYVFTEQSCKGHNRRILCHICQKQNYGFKALIQHSTHPLHTSNLQVGNFLEGLFTKVVDTLPDDAEEGKVKTDAPGDKETKPSVVPGEPVPPGMEEIVAQECQIQASFDAYTAGPLIGLEYIVELVSEDQSEPRYICLLCEKKGDPRSVLMHVISFNHYFKYICCFFRSVGNKLNMMPKATTRKTLYTAVIKVAEAIENHYGRLKPTSANEDTFSVKKYEILREIDDRDHFRETPTTNFLELVTAEKMKQYLLQPVSKESPLVLQKAEEEKKAEQLKIEKEIAREKDKSYRQRNTLKKESDRNFDNVMVKQEKDDKEPKKLTIALKKPERAIPGIKQTEVQNPAMSQLGDLPALKSDESQPAEEEHSEHKEMPIGNMEDEDDVIILPDDGNEAIEVNSLSSISDSSLKSESRARSGRRRRSSDRYRSTRLRDYNRDRSRDRFRRDRGRNSLDRRGRSRDNSRSRTSRDRSRASNDRSKTSRDRSRTSRDRTRTSQDRSRSSLERSRARSSRERSRERLLDQRDRDRDRRELRSRYYRRDDWQDENRGRNARMDTLKRNSPDRRYRALSPRDRRDDRGLSPVIERGRSRESDLRDNRREPDARDNRNIRESSRERERRSDRYNQSKRHSECDLRDELKRDRFRTSVRADRRDSKSRERDRRDTKITSYERSNRRWSPDRDYPDRSRDRDFESKDRLRQIQLERENKQKWEAYRKELSEVEEEVAKSYKFYQLRPERHPMYPDEWKSFWNRRYKEIQLTGQDPNAYDYKPEWILFWQKKMKELQDAELVTKKEEVKTRNKIDTLEEPHSLDLQDISPPTPEQAKDVTVQDIKKTWKELTGSEITTAEPAPDTVKDQKRSTSPWEESSRGTKRSLSPAEERVRRANTPPWERNRHTDQPREPRKYDSKRDPFRAPVPPVVHCLRLLSVLEDQIGIQGPRVLDLLTQALALEKTRPSGSMMLLENKDVYLFFEAIMEKLRGQLMVGIVMRHLVGTTSSVIKAIKCMLMENALKPEAFEPVTVPGVGAVDKVAVAQKIAASLVAMGRTNVSQEELEQLISAVIGMASSDNISADISTDKFFSQLNMKNSNASSHINTILQSMISSAQQSVQSVEPQSTQPVQPIQPVQPLQAVEPQSCQLKQSIESVQSVPNNDLSLIPTEDISSEPEPVKSPPPTEVLIPGLGDEDVANRAPSPFSLRAATGANPIGPENNKCQNITSYDIEDEEEEDDEDDYSFEDVFQAAEKKVKQTELEKKKDTVDTPEAENSQTQSSFSSIPTESMKAVNDLFKSLSAINAAPPVEPSVVHSAEPPKENPTNQMLANIASLSQPLSLPEDPPTTKPFDNTSSLVASIKNSLVESFGKDNSTSVLSVYSADALSTRSDPPPSRESRRALDPRSREQWDPSLRDLNKQDPYSDGGKEWSGSDRWGSGYGNSDQYTERPNMSYDSCEAYRVPESHYHPAQYRDDYGEAPTRESAYGPRSMNYDDPRSGYGHPSISRPYEPGPPREQPYHQMRGPYNRFNFRGPQGNPRAPSNGPPIPRPWAPPSVRPGYY